MANLHNMIVLRGGVSFWATGACLPPPRRVAGVALPMTVWGAVE